MEKLEEKIEHFLRTGQGDFDALALELFAYQFERNAPYQAFCQAQGKTPATVQRWPDIPAVSTQAFKSSVLTTFPKERAAAVFHSSATTGQTPSSHYLKTLNYYETALKTGFQQGFLLDQKLFPFLILTPSPGEAPHSSLSWMMDVVRRQFGAPESDYFIRRGLLDDWKLVRVLRVVQEQQRPVALLGTTLVFLAFFNRCRAQKISFRLPTESHLMDTGGMKTQQREVSRNDFLAQVQEFLGLPENHCFNEYGMCEMGSQFYSRGNSLTMRGPAWVKTLIIDPLTGTPAPEGKTGLLRHFDLTNVDSVMAIQTEDLGQASGEGFALLGRAENAELKGCSLAAEAYFKKN